MKIKKRWLKHKKRYKDKVHHRGVAYRRRRKKEYSGLYEDSRDEPKQEGD